MTVMIDRMSIDELAEAAGLTRRAVRFYVQQKLLPTPLGVGRGKHYDRTHLEQIKRVQELQTAGYSLDAIRQIMAGGEAPQPAAPVRRRSKAAGVVDLWTHLKIADGLELHLDLKRFNPDVQQLLAARELLRDAFDLNGADESEPTSKSEEKSNEQAPETRTK
jgi:DNA-binding transcriptional MerR regulator